MLVKFLSFVASVLGTARYKAVLLSAFAVVISLTGVTAVAVFKDSGAVKNASSTVSRLHNDPATAQGSSPQLGNTPKQDTKNTVDTSQSQPSNTGSQSQAGNSATTQPSNTQGASSDNQSNTTPDVAISLSKTSLTLAAGTLSDALTANTSDKSAVAWSITPVDSGDKGAHAVISQNNSPVLSFQIQTDNDVTPGSQIHFKVTARDASRNINTSEVITVIIQ